MTSPCRFTVDYNVSCLSSVPKFEVRVEHPDGSVEIKYMTRGQIAMKMRSQTSNIIDETTQNQKATIMNL